MAVLNETDGYRELPPPPALRDSLVCLWVRHGGGTEVEILPDGCCDIVWRLGSQPVVAGPDTRPTVSPAAPGEVIVGARFLPGAGGPALGTPLSELRNQRISLAELGLVEAERLDPVPTPASALRFVGKLAARLTAQAPPDRAVQAATGLLLGPRRDVDGLAAELGLSERQLRRRFGDAVGYGPKTLQRVLRVRRFMRGDRTSLARAALDAGFADQAHLARECRRLTGRTPVELGDTPVGGPEAALGPAA